MVSTSLFLLLVAAAVAAILHSILPDHWVPLAVVARTQRWSLFRVMHVTVLASLGHVLTSLVLGGIIALIGLQFQKEIDTQQGHLVGIVLILTGILFLLWEIVGRRIHRHRYSHDHKHVHAHDHHEHGAGKEQTLLKRLASIAIPFGVAASPDLTILPVALAAGALGTIAVVSVLGMFALLTIATFVSLTVMATLVGYQMKGDWLENHAITITSVMLIGIGLVAFFGF